MAHNNGIITKPINVRGDIAYVLGRSTGDLGQLCRDVDANNNPVNALNKKAFYIPFADTGNVFLMTDAIRKAHNWGHSYQAYTSIIDAIQSWSNEHGFFPWLQPTIRCRALDFEGYNHNAGNWFSLAPASSPVRSDTVKVLWSLNWEDFFGSFIGKIGVTTPDIQHVYDTYNFGFLMMAVVPSASFAGTPYWYQVTDLRDPNNMKTLRDICADEDGNRIPMYISGQVPEGTWYAIPCFTSYTDPSIGAGTWHSIRDLDGQPMLLFPFCNLGQIVVSSSGSSPASDALDTYDVSIDAMTIETISAADLIYEIQELMVVIDGSDATANRDISYSIQITDAMTGGNVTTGTVSVPASDLETIEPIKEDRQETWHRYQSGGGDSVLQVILSLTVQGETATKTFTFPIEDTHK